MYITLLFTLEWIKYLLFFKSILKMPLRRSWTIPLEIALLFFLLHTDVLNIKISVAYLIAVIAITLLFLTAASWPERFSCVILSVFILSCTDEILVYLLDIIAGNPLTRGSFVNSGYFISNLLILTVLFLITLFKPAIRLPREAVEKTGFGLGMFSGIIGILLVLAFSILQSTKNHPIKLAIHEPFLIVIALTGILFHVGIIFYIGKMNQQIHGKLAMERQFAQLQKDHYELLLKREEDTRRFRHDLSNHLLCIREFAENHLG